MLIARSDAEVWMSIAHAELGVLEAAHGDNPRVLAYLQSCHGPRRMLQRDATAWCSAFVNWTMQQAKIQRTHSLAARSWNGYGDSCGLCYGAIVVLWRVVKLGPEVINAPGHVGLCVDHTAKHVELLGGNQGNKVSLETEPRSKIIAIRRPTEDMIRYRNTFHGI